MTSDHSPRHFAVVPAAGVGTRVGAGVPKQYLEVAGVTVLERSLDALCSAPWIDRIVVVSAPGDDRARQLLAGRSRVEVHATGGATRRDSVLAGLMALEGVARAHDWVLVHDAARPGLTGDSLDTLRAALANDEVGGLLALPVADTVKRADVHGRIAATVSRDGLWLAQTPQMFRFERLHTALAAHPHVTDEAAAVEAAGAMPLLVAGERRNFKVTTAEDLRLMTALLAGDAQGGEIT